MNISKESVTQAIQDFEKIKNSITIKTENLTNLLTDKKEDELFMSFINGQGGYYVKFLNYLIKTFKPENVVELGNREGISTLSIYDAMQGYDSTFYTIDIEKDQRYCPESMFADTDKVKFIFGDVCDIRIIDQLPKKIDFLFSDTIHYDFQIRDEFEIYQHLLADTALVAIDDINLNDKRGLFDEVPYSKWDLTELCHQSGWGLFLFERKVPVDEMTRSENIYRSTIDVWKRKYDKANALLDTPTLYQKGKNFMKKMSPLYKLYTKSYNATHAALKKNGILK